jgi:POT family proton-dependent oligopeptide transporter
MKTIIIDRQPPCIYILFLTEMWERFGFYIVQILLIFYLTKVYHFSDKLSVSILGAFTAISYITPVVGGYLADRIMGYKHCIVFGGLLLAAGYGLLAAQSNDTFYLALSAIAIGTGFFKPNISTYLGNFYSDNDTRCERGYTIFYIGINVGIILATMTSGYILEYFGWRANFILASLGLLIAVITFTVGLNYLKKTGRLTMLRPIKRRPLNTFTASLIILGTLVSIYLFSLVISNVELANIVFIVGAVAVWAVILTVSYRSGGVSTGKMLACLLLISLSTLFWALYYQLFFSLNLFIDRVLDRGLFGHELPSTIFISLLPIFIMILGPLIGWMWQALDRVNLNPSATTKFAMSLFCMAAGLFILTVGTHFTNSTGLVNKQWVVMAYFMFTLGELLISPICIAMVINLVPSAYAGMMMGVYLAAIGFGAKLASVVAGMAAIPESMQETSMIVSVYQHAFLVDAVIATVSAFVILAAAPAIKWLRRAELSASHNEAETATV